MDAATKALAARHYRQQLEIRAALVRISPAIWRMWRGTGKDEWKRMVAAATVVVRSHHRLSAVAGARHFEQLSLVQTGRVWNGELPPELDSDLIGRTLSVTALSSVYNGRMRGLSVGAAKQVGFTRFAGAMSRMALNGGRDAVVASVGAAGPASGYARVTGPNPCDFCASLAGERSGSDTFECHDHCSCSASPLF